MLAVGIILFITIQSCLTSILYIYVGKKKQFSLYPCEFLAETHCNKRLIRKKKPNRSLLTCLPHLHMGNNQEQIRNSTELGQNSGLNTILIGKKEEINKPLTSRINDTQETLTGPQENPWEVRQFVTNCLDVVLTFSLLYCDESIFLG